MKSPKTYWLLGINCNRVVESAQFYWAVVKVMWHERAELKKELKKEWDSIQKEVR